MAGQTLTTFDAVLKEYYGAEDFTSLMNDKVRLVSKIESMPKKVWEGRRIRFPVQTNRNWGGGFSSNDVLAQARNVETVESQVTAAFIRGRIQLSGTVMKASRSTLGSFAKVAGVEIEGMNKTLLQIMNRALWGDGTGKLAEISASNATTFTCRTTGGSGLNGNAGARHIRRDMLLVLQDGATVKADTLRVSAVNYTTGVVTVSAGDPSTAAAGDSVYMLMASGTSSRNAEIMGIAGINDDGTYVGTLQNINRTTYPIWKSNLLGNSGTLRNLSLDLIQQGIDLSDLSNGEEIDGYWCHHSVRAEAAKLLVADHYYVDTKDQGKGIKESLAEKDLATTVTYNGKPVIVEKDCPYYTIFGIPYNKLKLAPLSSWEWADDDGAVLSRVSGNDAFEAYRRWYGNLYTSDPHGMFVIRDVNATVSTAYTPS
ncbi:MAG: phage major capsid protein [Bacteroidota bacterium]